MKRFETLDYVEGCSLFVIGLRLDCKVVSHIQHGRKLITISWIAIAPNYMALRIATPVMLNAANVV
jgi:hypothetical protein